MKPIPALREALSFLTILPVGSRRHSEESAPERFSHAMAWFPLVGAGLGAAAAGVAWWALSLWSSGVGALLGLAVGILLTGGLHWDGFCDSVDGLAAWKPPEETLRVMRDSRIGAVGAVALVVLFSLQWAFVESIPSHRLLPVWAAAGALSRWALVASSYFCPSAAGQKGLGRLATDRKNRSSLAAATALAVGFSFCGFGAVGGAAALAAAACGAAALNRWFRSRLGGITGDTLGAVCVTVETLVFSVGAAR